MFNFDFLLDYEKDTLLSVNKEFNLDEKYLHSLVKIAKDNAYTEKQATLRNEIDDLISKTVKEL